MAGEDWSPPVRVLDRTNGSAAPHQERPNPLRRERWVDLGELYPGHQVLLRFNPTKEMAKDLPPLAEDASPLDKVRYGLKLIVRDHRIHFGDGTPDGPWIDPDTDRAMPSPRTDEFWDRLGQDIFDTIMGHLAAEQKKVSASIEQVSGLSIEALRAGPSGTTGSPSGISADSSPDAGSADPTRST